MKTFYCKILFKIKLSKIAFVVVENEILLIIALLAQRANYQPQIAKMLKCHGIRKNRRKNPDKKKRVVNKMNL